MDLGQGRSCPRGTHPQLDWPPRRRFEDPSCSSNEKGCCGGTPRRDSERHAGRGLTGSVSHDSADRCADAPWGVARLARGNTMVPVERLSPCDAMTSSVHQTRGRRRRSQSFDARRASSRCDDNHQMTNKESCPKTARARTVRSCASARSASSAWPSGDVPHRPKHAPSPPGPNSCLTTGRAIRAARTWSTAGAELPLDHREVPYPPKCNSHARHRLRPEAVQHVARLVCSCTVYGSYSVAIHFLTSCERLPTIWNGTGLIRCSRC